MTEIKELSKYYTIMESSGIPTHQLLTAILEENSVLTLIREGSLRRKENLLDLFQRKAGKFYKSGLYQKSLFYSLLVYGILKQMSFQPITNKDREERNWVRFKNNKLFKVVISKNDTQTNYFSNKLSDSLLFDTLLKLSKCFSKMNNFKETYECLEEAEMIESRSSYLYFLLAKTNGYTSLFNQSQIQKASNYLRKSKFLFTKEIFFENAERTLNKLKLTSLQGSIRNFHLFLLRAKKTIEKWNKQKSHKLIQNVITNLKNNENTDFDEEKEWKRVERQLGMIKERLSETLVFYKKNQNNTMYDQAKADYIAFSTLNAEIHGIKQIEINLKILNSKTKNQLITIFTNKNQKTSFNQAFEIEKVKEISLMLKKRIKGSQLDGYISYLSSSDDFVKALSTKALKRIEGRRSDLRLIWKDFAFLLFFIAIIINFNKRMFEF